MNNLSGLKMTSEFKVVDIIEALKKFKEEHEIDLKKANDVYMIDLIIKYEENISMIEKKNIPEVILDNFGLTKPVDNIEMYSGLIKIYSLVQTENVTLDIEEANKIFNNNWDWVTWTKSINKFYTSRS